MDSLIKYLQICINFLYMISFVKSNVVRNIWRVQVPNVFTNVCLSVTHGKKLFMYTSMIIWKHIHYSIVMFEHFLENEKATIPFKLSTHQIQIFIKGEEKQSHVLIIFCNVDLIRFFDVWGEKRRKIIQHNESITKKCDYKKSLETNISNKRFI